MPYRPFAKGRARKAFVDGLLKTHAGKIREGDANAVRTMLYRALRYNRDNGGARAAINHLLEQSNSVRAITSGRGITTSRSRGSAVNRLEGDLRGNVRMIVSYGRYHPTSNSRGIVAETVHTENGWKDVGAGLRGGEIRSVVITKGGRLLDGHRGTDPARGDVVQLVDRRHEELLKGLSKT